MSTRRSGRATNAVKYTSASEGSDFEDKKKKKPKKPTKTNISKKTLKAANATPKKAPSKKASKRAAESDAGDDNDNDAPTNGTKATSTTTAPNPKRQKKDPANPLLSPQVDEAKNPKAAKALYKKQWQDWLSSHATEGGMLLDEPTKEQGITQTDALKKHGLKRDELISLQRFEKKNPLYGGTMKLFLEEEVRDLAFRKLGTLTGGYEDSDGEVVRRGKEVWMDGHKHDAETADEEEEDDVDTKNPAKTKATTTKPAPAPAKENKKVPTKPEKNAPPKAPREKTPKQKWSAYTSTHSIVDEYEKLTKEPSHVINQTECKTKYGLTPQDLACLPFFPKKNPVYGKIMKLFDESQVKNLAYRKTAVLAGVEDDGDDDEVLVGEGRRMFERQMKDYDEDHEDEE